MKTEKKVYIKIDDEQNTDNVRSRRTLRDIQQAATDKENIAGRTTSLKEVKHLKGEKIDVKKPKVLMQHKAVQVGKHPITTEDLTSDEPGIEYWKTLAHTKETALNKSLQENEKLKEDIAVLQEENKICKEMLEESRHLVEVLQEMISEKDDDDETRGDETTD